MGAEAEDDVLGEAAGPLADRGEGGDAEVGREGEHPDASGMTGVESNQLVNFGVTEGIEVNSGAGDPVVPPEGDAIPLDELEEALEHGVFEAAPGGVPVRISPRRRSSAESSKPK